mmetsp:Transcript_742/g.1796  ORF Transcript_742/g.1796 Transcript_742/m.1796 type:complete len:176 (+) Transcript_742:185-712(+)
MNDDTETTITLTSKPQEDGTTRSFQIPYAAAQISGTIMDAVGGDDDSDDDDGGEREETVVPLEQIDAACLEKIVKFLIHFKDEKMREIPATSFGGLAPQPFDRIVTQEWYRNFVDDTNMQPDPDQMLFYLVRAANYLSIQPLLDLVTLKAYFILQKKKNYREIIEFLHLPDDEES